MKKTAAVLVTTGLLQMLHAGSHILPAIQSATLMTACNHEKKYESRLEENLGGHVGCGHGGSEVVDQYGSPRLSDAVFHSPYAGYVWGGIGLLSIGVGVADARRHRRQNKYILELEKRLSELSTD